LRYTLKSAHSGEIVAEVAEAGNWWTKGIGVIGMRELPAGRGLWMPGVTAVHTWFVRFPLDLLFLDRESRVVKAVMAVRPWTSLVWAPGSAGVVELGAGTLLGDEPEFAPGAMWVLAPIGE
jgi:uncharacterized membrane protein (UPF0127 family)